MFFLSHHSRARCLLLSALTTLVSVAAHAQADPPPIDLPSAAIAERLGVLDRLLDERLAASRSAATEGLSRAGARAIQQQQPVLRARRSQFFNEVIAPARFAIRASLPDLLLPGGRVPRNARERRQLEELNRERSRLEPASAAWTDSTSPLSPTDLALYRAHARLLALERIGERFDPDVPHTDAPFDLMGPRELAVSLERRGVRLARELRELDGLHANRIAIEIETQVATPRAQQLAFEDAVIAVEAELLALLAETTSLVESGEHLIGAAPQFSQSSPLRARLLDLLRRAPQPTLLAVETGTTLALGGLFGGATYALLNWLSRPIAGQDLGPGAMVAFSAFAAVIGTALGQQSLTSPVTSLVSDVLVPERRDHAERILASAWDVVTEQIPSVCAFNYGETRCPLRQLHGSFQTYLTSRYCGSVLVGNLEPGLQADLDHLLPGSALRRAARAWRGQAGVSRALPESPSVQP